MKLRCQHGYFIIEETSLGQISDFVSLTGLLLVPKDHYYTFQDLSEAPEYSLAGAPYLTGLSTKTFQGKPGEVFEANGFVYNFLTGLIVPIASITQQVKIDLAGNRLVSQGLILPGSLTVDGDRVKDYSAWFSRTNLTWKYSEVQYV